MNIILNLNLTWDLDKAIDRLKKFYIIFQTKQYLKRQLPSMKGETLKQFMYFYNPDVNGMKHEIIVKTDIEKLIEMNYVRYSNEEDYNFNIEIYPNYPLKCEIHPLVYSVANNILKKRFLTSKGFVKQVKITKSENNDNEEFIRDMEMGFLDDEF